MDKYQVLIITQAVIDILLTVGYGVLGVIVFRDGDEHRDKK